MANLRVGLDTSWRLVRGNQNYRSWFFRIRLATTNKMIRPIMSDAIAKKKNKPQRMNKKGDLPEFTTRAYPVAPKKIAPDKQKRPHKASCTCSEVDLGAGRLVGDSLLLLARINCSSATEAATTPAIAPTVPQIKLQSNCSSWLRYSQLRGLLSRF